MMASCSSCGAGILWTVTRHGRALPVDAERGPDGAVFAIDDPAGPIVPTGATDYVNGQLAPLVDVRPLKPQPSTLTLDLGLEPDPEPARRWRPHHATCPTVDQHRRPGPDQPEELTP
jgi:hypothetical protein